MRYRDLPEREQWALAQELSNRYAAAREADGPLTTEQYDQMSRDLLAEKGYDDG